MPILVGIDGTGEQVIPGKSRDAAYDISFKNSFVRKICRESTTTKYFRGPVALGGGMRDSITKAVSFIKDLRRQMPNEPVLLTGYSRGAAAVVIVAKQLQAANIPVRALMMFDCVDRYVFGDAEVVPNNVEFVKHVIRDPAGRSRLSFGNDGMRYRPPTNYPGYSQFMCTHGGMGGTPWKLTPEDIKDGKKENDFIDEGALEGYIVTGSMVGSHYYKTNITYAQDAFVSKKVWANVEPFLKTHKFFD